jgi:hypothetical protein
MGGLSMNVLFAHATADLTIRMDSESPIVRLYTNGDQYHITIENEGTSLEYSHYAYLNNVQIANFAALFKRMDYIVYLLIEKGARINLRTYQYYGEMEFRYSQREGSCEEEQV